MFQEPVLIRSKPPKPTGKGKRLLNHFQQVMQLELELGIDSISENVSSLKPVTIRLAVNADSLATWLPEVLSSLNVVGKNKVKFEVVIDDQSVVLNKMKSGEVMACISSESNPINGGKAYHLGILRYQAVASPSFIKKYKITSLNELVHCPCLVFDENDNLQHQFLKDVLKCESDFMHFIPCPEGFKQSLIAGVGYGMLPELQLQDALSTGKLVPLSTEYFIDVSLYWHCWQSEGPQLEILRKSALAVSKIHLRHKI